MPHILTMAEVAEIKQLAEICNRYEGLRMPLRDLQPDVPVTAFLFYEDDQLVGYADIESDGVETAELIAMVHPDYRRQGIFHTLLNASLVECDRQGWQQLILICEKDSPSGIACLKSLGAQFLMAEYEMELDQFHDRFTFDDRLVVRLAQSGDLDALVTIRMLGMGGTEASARLRTAYLLQEPRSQTYIATFGVPGVSCAEPVGMMRVYDWPECSGIYGFALIPDYRGRGYGRQMLEEIIRTIQANSSKKIMLNVNVDNTNALGLYLSCGFVVKATYGYYIISN